MREFNDPQEAAAWLRAEVTGALHCDKKMGPGRSAEARWLRIDVAAYLDWRRRKAGISS